MGVRTVVVYSCEQCDAKARIDAGPMGGGGTPQGWFNFSQHGVQYWFDSWACVAAFGEAQAAAPAEEVQVNG